MFPTWPTKNERIPRNGPSLSPRAPEGGKQFALMNAEEKSALSRFKLHTAGQPSAAANALTSIALGHHLKDKSASSFTLK